MLSFSNIYLELSCGCFIYLFCMKLFNYRQHWNYLQYQKWSGYVFVMYLGREEKTSFMKDLDIIIGAWILYWYLKLKCTVFLKMQRDAFWWYEKIHRLLILIDDNRSCFGSKVFKFYRNTVTFEEICRKIWWNPKKFYP